MGFTVSCLVLRTNRCTVDRKLPSLLFVPLGKTLNRMPLFLMWQTGGGAKQSTSCSTQFD